MYCIYNNLSSRKTVIFILFINVVYTLDYILGYLRNTKYILVPCFLLIPKIHTGCCYIYTNSWAYIHSRYIWLMYRRQKHPLYTAPHTIYAHVPYLRYVLLLHLVRFYLCAAAAPTIFPIYEYIPLYNTCVQCILYTRKGVGWG